jgi:dolichol-phosphate hexosyltransferase
LGNETIEPTEGILGVAITNGEESAAPELNGVGHTISHLAQIPGSISEPDLKPSPEMAYTETISQPNERLVAPPPLSILPGQSEDRVSFKTDARSSFRLSIIVPVFNEARSVAATLQRLLAVDLGEDFEVLVVNDGSTDGTSELLAEISHPRLRVKTLSKNIGKGAAVQEGILQARGTHVLIFDADEEYRAADIPALIDAIIEGRAEVVYGVRRRGHNSMFPDFIHAFGNAVMTLAANLLFNSAMTDMHTCLKLIPAPLLRKFELDELGFGLDTQMTAEMLRHGFRPYEVPISYVGRTKEQGKKIKTSDALECLKILVKVRCKRQTSHAHRDLSLAPPVRSAAS